jgi:hypothetical protein
MNCWNEAHFLHRPQGQRDLLVAVHVTVETPGLELSFGHLHGRRQWWMELWLKSELQWMEQAAVPACRGWAFSSHFIACYKPRTVSMMGRPGNRHWHACWESTGHHHWAPSRVPIWFRQYEERSELGRACSSFLFPALGAKEYHWRKILMLPTQSSNGGNGKTILWKVSSHRGIDCLTRPPLHWEWGSQSLSLSVWQPLLKCWKFLPYSTVRCAPA